MKNNNILCCILVAVLLPVCASAQISQLPVATEVEDVDYFVINDESAGPATKRVSGADMKTYFSASSSAWGDITGTPTTLGGYGITDAATTAQGALADTALQPADIDTFAELDTVVADSSLLKMGYLEIIMQVPEGTDFVDFELKASATGYVGVIPNDADVTSFTIGGGQGALSAKDGLRGRYTKVNSTLWRHTQKAAISGTIPRISELRHNGTRWELYEADDLVYYTAATGTDGITNSDIYPWLITVWGLDPVAFLNEWDIGTIGLRPNDESIIYYFHSPAPQVFELGDPPKIWFTESGGLTLGGDTRKNIYHQYPNYGATGIYNTLPASSRVGSVRVVITDPAVLALCRGTDVQWSWLWWSPTTYENDGFLFDGNLRPIWRIPSMKWINEIPTP